MFIYIILAILGLIFGSFFNVCIFRIPIKISIVSPPSHCPNCSNNINWYDNIPILSYIILKGKCRYCKKKISMRYPFIELFTSIVFVLVGYKFGLSIPLIPYLIFVSSLIVISLIDYDYKIIPNVITYPGMILGLLFSFIPKMPINFISSIIGLISCFILFELIAILSRKIWKKEGMGGGDIKLIAMIGAFLGWRRAFFTIFCASLLGSICGMSLILTHKKNRNDVIPFGPFLCIGAFIALLYGQEIINWYLLYTNVQLFFPK